MKGMKGKGKGGGGGGAGPMAKFLNAYCQLQHIMPAFEFSETRTGFSGGSSWKCVLRLPGFGESQATGANRGIAQEAATRDMVVRLQASGVVIRVAGGNQLAGAHGPSWAIGGCGGAGGLLDLPPPEKRLRLEDGQAGNAGTAAQPPKRNIGSQLKDIERLLRGGEADTALGYAEARLEGCPHAMTIRQLANLMMCVGVRSREADVLAFFDGLASLELPDFPNPEAAAYFWRFGRWAVREFLAEGLSCEDSAANMIPQALERQGTCISHLVIQQTDKGQGALQLSPPSGQLPQGSNFNFGDWVFLTVPHYGQVRLHSDNGQPVSFEAEVLSIQPPPESSITVKVVGKGEGETQMLIGKTCRIDRAANHVTFRRQINALLVVCVSPGELDWLSLILLSAEEPGGFEKVASYCGHFPPTAIFPARSPVLRGANSSQYTALHAATTRRCTLIQGPPGAGKTSTAVLLMRLWATTGRKPILATADSNIAADNLVAGCAGAGLKVVRVGRKEALRPDLQEYSLFERARAVGGPGGPRVNWKAERRVLQEADVVCCTCSGAEHPAMQDMKFKNVLIDEAGQTTELASLIPMMHLQAEGSVVLVGDHRQLPATVACLEADVEGLGTSFFERLATLGVPPCLLDIQYRMHPAIAAFPSMQYYGGRLRSGVEGSVRSAPAGIQWPCKETPIAFLPIQSTEVKEGNSFTNPTEADTILELLSALTAARDLLPNQVGIITPYAAQARVFRTRLGIERGAGRNAAVPEVSSVDGFQGREKELIFISTVRANTQGRVGFLADPRRLNVMLTRARRGLVVVGDFATLASDAEGWRPWLIWAQERGLIVGCPATNPSAAEELRRLDRLKRQALLIATTPEGQEVGGEALPEGGFEDCASAGDSEAAPAGEAKAKPRKKSLLMQIREEEERKAKEAEDAAAAAGGAAGGEPPAPPATAAA